MGAPQDSTNKLKRSLVLVMAVSTGLAVANLYYAQPLLPVIGKALHMSPGLSGIIVTVAQAGYAASLLFVLPLGDVMERRRLATTLAVASALALLWLGSSSSAGVLLPAAFVLGATSVLAQVLVPFAASLASDEERGRVVGMVMSGLLIGILLARTVSGALAQASGSWRIVYFVAAGVMLAEAAVLRWRLPAYKETTALTYGAVLRSVFALVKDEPVLRLRALYGLLSFGTFSILWTSLAFELSRRYHYSSAIIGLFGLAGAAGAFTATVAGRLSDKGEAKRATGVTTVLLAVSWLALWAGGTHVVWLVVGIVVLDIGAQGLHITNQGEIYKLHPEARSRLTAAYMVIFFVGGAIGSAIAATVYERSGWSALCVAGECFALATVVLWLVTLAWGRQGRAAPLASPGAAGFTDAR